jgi:hypothetical protein
MFAAGGTVWLAGGEAFCGLALAGGREGLGPADWFAGTHLNVQAQAGYAPDDAHEPVQLACGCEGQ